MKKKVLLTTAFVIILASTGQSQTVLCEYGMVDILQHEMGGASIFLVHTTQEDIDPSQRKEVSNDGKKFIKQGRTGDLYGTHINYNNGTIWKTKFAMLQSAMLAKIPVRIFSKGDCSEFEDKFLVTVCVDVATCY